MKWSYLTNRQLSEELSSYQKEVVDPWVEEHSGRTPDDDIHDDVFENLTGDRHASRAVIPFTTAGIRLNNQGVVDHVARHIHQNGGWTIHDYKQGIATRKLTTKKGFTKPEFKSIGGILQDTNAKGKSIAYKNEAGEYKKDNLYDAFVNDTTRSSSSKSKTGLQMVISRHPHDVAGMSSGRSWYSCMTIPGDDVHESGCNHHYIEHDIKHRTLVAYLTKAGDDNIQKPIARIAIKKFHGDDGDVIWRPENSMYGNGPSEFFNNVNHFANVHYPAKDQHYQKEEDLYNDSHEEYHPGDEETHGIPGDPIHVTKNESGQLHSHDDKPAVITKLGDTTVSRWYHNGTLHRDNGPAEIKHKTINGEQVEIERTHYQHGQMHSPRDGKTAAREQYTYDEKGDLVGLHHTFNKFNMLHDSVMNGISSITANEQGVTIQKNQYGTLHTDDETPSHFSHIKVRYGGGTSISKSWHHYGKLVKRNDISVQPNGDITGVYHFESPEHGKSYSNNWAAKSKDGRDGGNIERRNIIPDITENITYLGDKFEHEPKNIITRQFTSSQTGTLTKAPYPDTPSYYDKHERVDGISEATKYVNSIGKLDHPTDFAHVLIEHRKHRDGSITLKSFGKYRYTNGMMPKPTKDDNNLVVSHDWHAGDNGHGSLTVNHKGYRINTIYKGQPTTTPTEDQIASRKFTDSEDKPVNGPNGELHYSFAGGFEDANDKVLNHNDKGRVTSLYTGAGRQHIKMLLNKDHYINVAPEGSGTKVTLYDKDHWPLANHQFDENGKLTKSSIIDINLTHDELNKNVPEWTPEHNDISHFTSMMKFPKGYSLETNK